MKTISQMADVLAHLPMEWGVTKKIIANGKWADENDDRGRRALREIKRIRDAVMFMAQNGMGHVLYEDALIHGLIPVTKTEDLLPGQVILGDEKSVIAYVAWAQSFTE